MRKQRGGCGDRDRGGATGKDSKIEADCIKAEDGSVTCVNETEKTSLGTRGFTHGLQSLKGL